MKWTEKSAIECLKRNRGMVSGKKVWHQSPGIKLLGCIDFLVGVHGYRFEK